MHITSMPYCHTVSFSISFRARNSPEMLLTYLFVTVCDGFHFLVLFCVQRLCLRTLW